MAMIYVLYINYVSLAYQKGIREQKDYLDHLDHKDKVCSMFISMHSKSVFILQMDKKVMQDH